MSTVEVWVSRCGGGSRLHEAFQSGPDAAFLTAPDHPDDRPEQACRSGENDVPVPVEPGAGRCGFQADLPDHGAARHLAAGGQPPGTVIASDLDVHPELLAAAQDRRVE